MKTTEAVIGRWPSVLTAMGMDNQILTGKHTACPMCGGRDRFRFDNKDGKGTYFCNQCGAGDGWKLLQGVFGLEFKQAAQQIDSMINNIPATPIEQKNDPRKRLRRLAGQIKPLSQAGYVQEYLMSRGIAKETLSTVKNLGGCGSWGYYEDGRLTKKYPVMTGFVEGNEPLTYHVTYLDHGKKAAVNSPKKLLTPVQNISGGAIRLFDYEDALGVAEGIETALSASQLFDIPTWCVVNENGMRSIVLPPDVKALFVFADNDKSFVGQAAAYDLAKRYAAKGVVVTVKVPPVAGSDWNDVLLSKKRVA